MTGEPAPVPTYHTARHQLETQRQGYNRDTVRALAADGWGVYAIWDGPYDCLYIGKSAAGESVKTRLLAHLSPQERRRNRPLYEALYLNRDRVAFAVCLTHSPEWATELEQRLIRHYQPECNRNLLNRDA